MKRSINPMLFVFGFAALLLIVYGFVFTVRFSEVAVKVRMGKADEGSVITEPGLKFRLPIFDSVRKFDTRVRVLETNETEIKTQDKQNLIVGCFALWRIKDPLQYYKRVASDADASNLLRQRIDEVRATVIGSHALADIVNRDADQLRHDQIEAEMVAAAAPPLAADYGVELLRVGIRRISLPEEATATVQEAMKAEREAIAKEYTQEGESVASAITARAKSQRDQILAFADRKAQEIIAEGIRGSERVLAAIGKEDEGFFILLQLIEALKAGLSEGSTIFIDSNSELFRVFQRPLEPDSPEIEALFDGN